MKRFAILLVGIGYCLGAGDAFGVSIPIVDPGFDIYTSGTLDFAPNDILPNQGSPGAGGGPTQNVPLLDFNTFASRGNGDIPAGWTATGQKPNGSANTARMRCDECFLSPSGSMASISSFHSDSDPSTQGKFFQILSGVTALPNMRYTATVEVSDLNIMGHGPFAPSEDNVVLGDPTMIKLNLSAVTSTDAIDLGGLLSFADLTSGGIGTADARISGGKVLLTLVVDTGSSVPSGDLEVSFTSGGVFGELPGSFASSAQTYFDNVKLDAVTIPARLDGDFNGDGFVDAADYVTWRAGAAAPADYDLWRDNFGRAASEGNIATAAASSTVPEPGSLMMVVSGFLSLLIRLARKGTSQPLIDSASTSAHRLSATFGWNLQD